MDQFPSRIIESCEHPDVSPLFAIGSFQRIWPVPEVDAQNG